MLVMLLFNTVISNIKTSCTYRAEGVYFVRNILYDLENLGTFGVQNRICRDTGTKIYKIHKTGLPRENRDEWDPTNE
jgi:hypothetical protein